MTRDVAKNISLSSDYSSNIFMVKLILSIVTIILIGGVIFLLGYDNYTIAIVMTMGIYLAMNAFFDFFVAISDAHERMEVGAIIKVINKFLISIFGGAVLFLGGKLIGLLDWMIIGSALSVLLGFYLIKKKVSSIKTKVDWVSAKKILNDAWPIALTMTFAIAFFKIDIVMLSLYNINNADIGLYSASVKLIEVLNVIPAIIVGGVFPIMASLLQKSKDELVKIFSKVFQILIIIVIPVIVITTFLSEELINMIYGSAYAGSENALKILIWTSLFIFPNFILLNLIIVLNRQRLNMMFSFSCLLLNIILNIFLIPRYGFIGASYATVATDMLLFALAASFAVRYFSDLGFIKSILKPILCGIALSIIIFSIQRLNIALITSIAVLSYILLLFASKTLTFEDIRQFRKVLVRS